MIRYHYLVQVCRIISVRNYQQYAVPKVGSIAGIEYYYTLLSRPIHNSIRVNTST